MQVTIQSIPASLQEFETLAAGGRQPERICALFLCALALFDKDRDAGTAAMNLLRGPRPMTPYDAQFLRDRLDGQLKTELLTALQPAFAKISDMGIRYSALPGHTMELADALNEVLSGKWRNLRGLEIVSFGVSSVKASEEDEQMLKEMQRNAAFMDPTRAAAHLVGAQAAAMQSAASNQGAGPAMAFMGMNMAGQMGGMNAQGLYQMGAQQQAQQPAPAAPAEFPPG